MSAVARQLTINVRSARGAADRRRKRSGALRYRSIVHMLLVLGTRASPTNRRIWIEPTRVSSTMPRGSTTRSHGSNRATVWP
jgi:hypothetical protein